MNKNKILGTISLVAILGLFLIPSITAQSDEYSIPSWIKVVAGAWSEDKITDSEYQDAMTFLIEHEIITIPGYGKIVEVDTPMITDDDDDELGITTDKSSYNGDETIIVSINLPNEHFDRIELTIRDTDGRSYGSKAIQSSGSEEATVSFELGQRVLLLKSGTYVVQCKYQGETVETTFEYTAKPVTGELTVTIDKQNYIEYETMYITGTVPDYKLDSVVLTMVWPNGVVADMAYVQVQEDYTYSLNTELHGQMNETGDYILQVTYYEETVPAKFEYTEYKEPIETPIEDPETYEIVVTTVKASYVPGETIRVSGTVTSTLENLTSKPIIITITDPDGDYAHIAHIEVAQDGTFSGSVIAEGPSWDKMGTYTVRLVYSIESIEITFDLTE